MENLLESRQLPVYVPPSQGSRESNTATPIASNPSGQRLGNSIEDSRRGVETYAQRVNHVVRKVFTTNYEGEPVEWAVFAAGTVVMIPATHASTIGELAVLAESILKENGPTCPGTPSGDFSSVQLTRFFGEGCAEWFVFFETNNSCPKGTALFGVYMGSLQSSLRIGLQQRLAREQDSQACQVVCTSFDLAPILWSPETHASFPLTARALVRLMLLVQQRSAKNDVPFVSHEILVKFVLPMLVQ